MSEEANEGAVIRVNSDLKCIKYNFDNQSYNRNMTEPKTLALIKSNPSALIIFDDCASSSSWTKNPQIEELFKNGRHSQIMYIKPTYQRMLIIPNPGNDPTIALLNEEAILFNRMVDHLENQS